MATLAELRAKAKRLGITASVIRGASTVKELQSVISDFNGDGKPAKSITKKTTTKRTARVAAAPKRRGRPPGSKNKPKVEEAPKRRGRPPGSGVKKSASGTKAPAKRTTAKRPSTAKRTTKPASDAGRFMLEAIDYRETDGWNPRPGSPPDRIVKALRKFRGNREKVFDFLLPDLWDFVGKVKQDGTRRTKADAERMLAYRIARTDWEFAVRTGQHQKSENRAEYGSQTGISKPKPKAAAKPKTPARRGRPPKAAVEAPKRRGRPPGSKNKPKVAAKPAARRTAAKPKPKTAARRTRR